jgi:hypothetical protein
MKSASLTTYTPHTIATHLIDRLYRFSKSIYKYNVMQFIPNNT